MNYKMHHTLSSSSINQFSVKLCEAQAGPVMQCGFWLFLNRFGEEHSVFGTLSLSHILNSQCLTGPLYLCHSSLFEAAQLRTGPCPFLYLSYPCIYYIYIYGIWENPPPPSRFGYHLKAYFKLHVFIVS